MAEEEKKKIKLTRFPLQLADGTGARSLEELRKHGDVESVLMHYREGTLARWLRAFGQQELAEKVAAHRNAQVEYSKANLQEVFGILEIPVAEDAFAEYCEKKLSKGFVFSDAEGGDLKSYGQGVSIKDKLLEFLPQGKLPGGESQEDWEVLETKLDEENLLVEFTCEKRNILVSLQFACEDEYYKKVANQLGRLVNAFNPAAPEYDTENTQESPKAQDVQELRNYRIGDTGPGGGMVYYIDGETVYEVSDDLGQYTWWEAKKKAESYCGGDFNDWRLPTRDELKHVLYTLVNLGKIARKNSGGIRDLFTSLGYTKDDWLWSSSQCVGGSSHYACCTNFGDRSETFGNDYNYYSVRAVRSFSIEG